MAVCPSVVPVVLTWPLAGLVREPQSATVKKRDAHEQHLVTNISCTLVCEHHTHTHQRNTVALHLYTISGYKTEISFLKNLVDKLVSVKYVNDVDQLVDDDCLSLHSKLC